MTTMLKFVSMCCLFLSTSAFPNGAPELACGGMVPGHLPSRTSGDIPFMLNISTSSYKAGDVLTGMLTSGSGMKFKGFLMEVRKADSSSEERFGEFTAVDSEQKNVCGKGGLTHTNNGEKQQMSFTWKAPEKTAGDLVFRATVVQRFFPSEYWTGLLSTTITAA